MAMYLPHEYQHNKVTFTHPLENQVVDVLGGREILAKKPIDIVAVAQFDGDTIVPTDRSEFLRMIGKSATEAIGGCPKIHEHLQECWELVRDITGIVEKHNWWPALMDLSEDLGFDMDNFLEPPLDILQLASTANPDFVFNFINFGVKPFDLDEIESAKKMLAYATRGVDLTEYDERPNNILIVPSIVAFIHATDSVIFMDEDIMKRFGGLNDEVLERYAKMVGLRLFGVDSDADVSDIEPLEMTHAILEYDAPWGLRTPTKITFDVVAKS